MDFLKAEIERKKRQLEESKLVVSAAGAMLRIIECY